MKKNIIKVFCLAAILFGMGSSVNAQFRQSIFLNGALPTGKFATSASVNPLHPATGGVPLGYEQVGKDAAIGFGLGYRASYLFDVGMGEVAPYVQADVFWNMINSDWRDKYMDADFSSPNYFNVPLLAGVSYFYDELWNDITPFGEFGVGADFMMITREGSGVSVNGGNTYYAYKPNFAMAWMLGAGAWFGRHVSAGLYYYGLGTHPIDYTGKTLEKNATAAAQMAANELANHGREKRTVGTLAIRVGFHF